MTAARLRWAVLTLVFTAGLINYMDRQIIALLKPLLEAEFGWDDRVYGHLISAFQLATAIAVLAAGWFIDRIGIRFGFPVAVGGWSLAAAAHAAVRTVGAFSVVRAALGLAEAVNTPASVKAIGGWFPPAERSLALGIMNAAPNIGAILTPLVVTPIAVAFGWRTAFLITAALGGLWVVAWFLLPRPPATAPVEAPPREPWLRTMSDRRAWAVAGCKLLTDQAWWFLLFWMPDFFGRRYGLDLAHLGPPLAVVYAFAMVGAFVGGWIPSRLIARGVPLGHARKGAMLAAALLVPPILTVFVTGNVWVAVVAVGVALAGHQAFSTNVFSLASDCFPADRLGSVIGLGAFCGNLSGLGMSEFAGWALTAGLGYWPMFAAASCAYLLAVGLVQILVPVLGRGSGRVSALPFAAGH